METGTIIEIKGLCEQIRENLETYIISNKEKGAEYISTILKEIHQEPLIKRSKNEDDNGSKNLSLIDKLVALIQTIKK